VTAIGAPPADIGASGTVDEAGPRRGRRRWVVLGVVVAVVVAGGVLLAVTNGFSGGSTSASIDNAAPTSLTTVTRQTLSAQTQVDATLGYAGSYSVVNQAPGTITALPAVGQIVSEGQVLYRVDDAPIVLLYGTTPAYRRLSEGAYASEVTGPDVQELNRALVTLGYATSAELDPTSDEFSAATKTALERFQAALGVTQDGMLALGQAVFLPTAARVTAPASMIVVGTVAQPGAAILEPTSPTRLVTIALDAAQQAQVKVGDAVTITLPDRRTTPGVVWSVGTVATPGTPQSPGSSSTPPTIEVDVLPTDPAATGNLDQAPVTVAITTATAQHALVVPVNALLALAEGGYAIEAVTSTGSHQLVPVTLGLFDDARGLVQISGPTVTAGQRVVVPAT
jgi:Putative peptidoglycan binding domain